LAQVFNTPKQRVASITFDIDVLMCGIALIAGASAAENTSALMLAMVAALHHRGPDGSGIKSFLGCTLGHTRLAIIDLAGGAQPMGEKTGRYWITFNGEIYNFRELRQELQAAGAVFHSNSDTEVILQCYIHYGASTPSKLNGQFAFAIWDTLERRLFAARDRLGEKPFYYAVIGDGTLLAASEIRALEASHLIQPKLSQSGMADYLSLGYVPPDRTIYENIQVLRPGHSLQYAAGKVTIQRYWEPPPSSSSRLSWADAVAETRFLLGQAVKRQMVADVPVGAFLSGGLDSSTIVALMAEAASGRIKTFSVGFGSLINELPYAKAVAERYQTDHHEIQMDIDVAEMLQRMAEVYDEPLADSANIPTYLVAGFARRHVKVALAGEGGDELFGGYWWHQQLMEEENAPTSDGALWIRRLLLLSSRLANRAGFASAWETQSARRYMASLAARKAPDPWDRCAPRHLAPPAFDNGTPCVAVQTASRLSQAFRPGKGRTGFDRVTNFDLSVYMAGDILPKADRASMAQGLEVRSPFLDADLLNFMLALPWRLRLEGGEGSKPLLRAACGQLWPDSVKTRQKQGFGAPIDSWVREPAVEALASRTLAAASPLNYILPGVTTAYQASNAQQKWTLICLGLWMERHAGALP
jgi:asparagine synthase (glutamine-hydrolysing)